MLHTTNTKSILHYNNDTNDNNDDAVNLREIQQQASRISSLQPTHALQDTFTSTPITSYPHRFNTIVYYASTNIFFFRSWYVSPVHYNIIKCSHYTERTHREKLPCCGSVNLKTWLLPKMTLLPVFNVVSSLIILPLT